MKVLRWKFIEAIQQEDVSQFKFVDEISVNLVYTRRYARALGGRRVDVAMLLHNGPTVTVVTALTPQSLEAVMELDGAVNTASFVVYLDQALVPTLQAGDVVVLDNLRVYKAAGLAELVEARGALPRPVPVKRWQRPCVQRWTGSRRRMPTAGSTTAVTTYINCESALNYLT